MLIIGVIMAVGGFVSGWYVQGTRMEARLASVKLEQSKEETKQADAAMADLVSAAKTITEAAVSAQLDVSGVNAKLDQIRRDMKNEKPKPLPADCKPDAPRMRTLAAATDAVDQAIAGSKPSSAVPDKR